MQATHFILFSPDDKVITMNNIGLNCIRFSSHRIIPIRYKSHYYVTTPIFYVNSNPHIGHLYTTTLADASCRWKRLRSGSDDVRLVTGTDEHGLKVMQAAQAGKLQPKQFCDRVSQKFSKLFDNFDVKYYDFIRTTDKRHAETVRELWRKVDDNGYIYKGSYEGWYCTSDETFLTDIQVDKEKRISLESGNPVEWMHESNYMFKLTHFIPQIKQWITNNPTVIHPPHYRDEVFRILDQLDQDLSVSRSTSRVPWGIPVPGDDTQTVYVWMDALSNYLTAAGFPHPEYRDMWPADVHFIGVDILKFHAVYWPAILLAAGLPLPKKIVVHSHWLYDGHKMSKSRGNVVDPLDAGARFTTHGFKYFLLRQSHLETNCNYIDKRVEEVINGDLANVMGNTLNRAVAKALNPDRCYPKFHVDLYNNTADDDDDGFSSEDRELVTLVRDLPQRVERDASEFKYQDAIFHLMDATRKANLLIHRNALWRLDRTDESKLKILNSKMYCVFECLRVAAILLQPFCPLVAERALDKLAIPHNQRGWEDAVANFLPLDGARDRLSGTALPTSKSVLFKAVQPSQTDKGATKKSEKRHAV